MEGVTESHAKGHHVHKTLGKLSFADNFVNGLVQFAATDKTPKLRLNTSRADSEVDLEIVVESLETTPGSGVSSTRERTVLRLVSS